MSDFNNVIGIINHFGASSFQKNQPLVIEELDVIRITKKFYEENLIYAEDIIDKRILNFMFSNENVEHRLDSVLGSEYKDIIKSIFSLYMEYEFIFNDFINKKYVRHVIPIGLISVPDPINLCFLGNIDNNNFIFSQDKILPFELNEDNVYIVINIDKSDDNLCIDNSFNTVTIIDTENDNFKTYIRITDENRRWSDWLEYEVHIAININIVKLLFSFIELEDFFLRQLLSTNEYEIKNNIYIKNNEYYSNNTSITCLDKNYLFTFNNESEYKWKISFFEVNHQITLINYITFVNSVINNKTFTPSMNELTHNFINNWRIIYNDIV